MSTSVEPATPLIGLNKYDILYQYTEKTECLAFSPPPPRFRGDTHARGRGGEVPIRTKGQTDAVVL